MKMKVIRLVAIIGRNNGQLGQECLLSNGIFFSQVVSLRKMMMTTQRGSSRAAVHGSNFPSQDTEDKEKVEEVSNKGKEQREKIRDDVENKVDSELKGEGNKTKGSHVLADSDSG
ncbi:hypothetical protein LIER_08644 [Lithospermum erythrorhizon]|uniref:Uncharacterized protein n=1 Tax=Lithospermum erythrorhizon TaxID=34254 RepID=A0AAV3PDN0_LITER